jgi:Ca2+-binding EF-hand superfamily protein
MQRRQLEYPFMKRSTTRFLTATAIAGIGLAGLAAVSLAEGDRGYGYWGRHDGGHHMGGAGFGGHHMGGRGFGGHGHMHELAVAYDANNDGKLSQEEIDQGRSNQLKKFDKDGDGKLTLAEYEELWMDAMRERMVDRFQEHDSDGDGNVTAEEFGKRFAGMVKFMDSNGDGVLDHQDMRRHHDGKRDDD